MLEPKKPGQDEPTSNEPVPAKEHKPTPAEGSDDFKPGTQDPNNPDKK